MSSMTTSRESVLSGGVRDRAGAHSGPPAWASVVLVVLVTLAAAAAFLPHQTLWVDETTQLSGLSLSPVEVCRWLTHPDAHDFGVPGDRMPPVSYWAGWAWSHVFGLNEHALRWFGVACTAGAAALLCCAARRAYGARAGLFAGLFLGLSPNVVVTAVEIRAYPIFLLTTAGALSALVSLLQLEASAPGGASVGFSWRRPSPERRAWVVLGAWLLVGMFVHFFAAVFAAAVMGVLAIRRFAARRPLAPVAGVGGVLALAALGLAPFVMASVGLSAVTVRDRIHEVAQLLYRLVGHPAMSLHRIATALAFVSVAGLTVASLRRASPARGLAAIFVAVLALGLGVSIAANFVVGGFTAAKVSYATWALPVLGLVLAGALAGGRGPAAIVSVVCALTLLACQATGTLELARHGDYFAHGPQRRLQRVLDASASGRRTAVIHADPLDAYAAAYFPLRFANGPGLAQFAVAEGTERPTLGTPLMLADAPWNGSLAGFDRLVIVRARPQSAQQLAAQLRAGDQPFPSSRVIDALEGSGQWRPLEHHEFVAFVAADVTVLERAPSSRSPSSPTVRHP